jgi:hypothetical protein
MSLSTKISTDILKKISENYLSLNSLKKFTVLDKNCYSIGKDAVEMVSIRTIKNGLISWHCRRKLQKFPIVTSIDQPIYTIVPPYWVLLLSLGVNKNDFGQKAREIFLKNDNKIFHLDLDNIEVDRETLEAVSQEYLRVQLISSRHNTFREYLETFETKLEIEIMDYALELISMGLTADNILSVLFSFGDFLYMGYTYESI